MIEKELITERGTVHYWRSDAFLSDRATLVFLHGLTADHTLFDKQVEYFSPDYNILVWDAPAHGKSRPYRDFTYPNAAENLKKIFEENNIETPIMIGQSMGGFITQSFLIRYPHMVKAFVGIDTCPYGEKYYSRSDRWWLRQVEWMARMYPLKSLKKAVAKNCTLSEYGRNNMVEALAPYGKGELCHLMGIGLAGFLEDNRDMDIRCPVLILCGEFDKTGKTKHYCGEWGKTTGFPLKFIKDAAHNSNADNPEEVNAAIEEFVNSLSA